MTSEQANAFIKGVRKRDGSVVSFDLDKVANAIYKAMLATNTGSDVEASMVANKVFAELVKISKKHKDFIPTVEGIQDTVEKELMLSDYVEASKSYILYRQERAQKREQGLRVPPKVRKLASDSKKYFKNPLAEFVYYRSYSRWMPEENRRETWIETVDRYMDFMRENLGSKLKKDEYEEIREYILHQWSMPSMRLMWSAGAPARKTNVCAYNCSFIAPSQLQDFGEIMYLSMCGTGVGFSVESQTIQQLPIIQKQSGQHIGTHVVDDSKEGWADAFVYAMQAWYDGKDLDLDYSQVRPQGARLKTMGGKASGPDPLKELMAFAKQKVLRRQGKRLTNLDAHDIICKIGEIVVAGGVRRSALISLSDLDDEDMRDAKKGQFFLSDPQRGMSNNSAVYEEKPGNEDFLDEWVALMKSQSGERGIFNRGGLKTQLPERRWKVFESHASTSGTNPCGEIILRSKQFCNLSEVVARKEDDEASLVKKARIAAILGTFQSTLTHFPYLSKEWKENCEEERLLGVSVTGQWDCQAVRNPETLAKIKSEALKVNKQYAKRFGINESTCVTCVKPSGTVSQLVDASSGMHPRHSKYYIRRVRITGTDSLFQMLKDQGVPFKPENGQSMESAHTFVLEFPVKSPDSSIMKDDMTALEQLEYWKMVKENYTEHNPSTTISVGPSEWVETANWLYENWDKIGGLSFLPRFDHVYPLAPYEECDEKTYKEMLKRFNGIDFSKIVTYEGEDKTEGAKELACVSGTCEIV
ncbi:MAG: ATP cone domain-containing protein [Candidatus Paceibacterota bacterium]